MLQPKPNSPCSPSLSKRGTFNPSKRSPSLGKRRGRVGRGDELVRSNRVFQYPASPVLAFRFRISYHTQTTIHEFYLKDRMAPFRCVELSSSTSRQSTLSVQFPVFCSRAYASPVAA